MVKMGAGAGNVEIDVCNTCGAKFLDNGELEKVREGGTVDLSKIDAIADSLFRENLKHVIGEKNYDNTNSSLRRQFFEDLVTRYMMR